MSSPSTDRGYGINSGMAIKVPCVVATTAAITLSGQQTIDGVAVVAGDRVLVKDQSSSVDNGIYVADTGDWSRAQDFDGARDITEGTLVKVNGGTVGQGFWYVTTTGTITPGTTAIVFGQASSVLAVISAYSQSLLILASKALWQAALEIIPNTLFTTIGDTLEATAANTPARKAAAATVAAHATTMNPWVAREVTLSGGAVTFTDIADAPYAGAVVWVKQNAAHIWTDGSTFNVQGGANYTAAADDWIRIYATTVSTFEVTIFKASGAMSAVTPVTNTLSGDVALNNTGSYFDGPSAAASASKKYAVLGSITVADTAGVAAFYWKLWDGTTVFASGIANQFSGASTGTPIPVVGYAPNPSGNVKISVRDISSTNGKIIANDSGNGKDSTITLIEIG